jgi:hypothetical protein
MVGKDAREQRLAGALRANLRRRKAQARLQDTTGSVAAVTRPETVCGDATGIDLPAHGEALRAHGAAFLTRAFRRFGVLADDNDVTEILEIEPCPGGSTGHKLFLRVAYARPEPALHAELFVKFSRDFDDPARDQGRYEMADEVRFAALSRHPAFPIEVPAVLFADYHRESGTGLLITQRIAFGRDGIEPHHEKCLDHLLPDPLDHYRAIVTALARLAAAHRSGRLSPDVETWFPFDAEAAVASDPIRFDTAQLRDQVARYATFAAACPQLLPPPLRSPAFIATLDREVGRFVEHERAIKRFLASTPDLIALCHWNAHIDNAWFRRDASGALECGLMDWGRVRQLNLAFALWGCLSGAPVAVWDDHLGELVALFVNELHRGGGPRLDAAELGLHLDLYVATMGVAWLLEAPARILSRLPEAATASGPHDPVFHKSERARNQLHILTNLLNLWRTRDFGASLDRMLAGL